MGHGLNYLHDRIAMKSDEGQALIRKASAFDKEHPGVLDVLAEAAEKLEALLPKVEGRALCDAEQAWYQASLMLANMVKPPKTWWVVDYMAPFDSRAALLAGVVLVDPHGRMLITKRPKTMPDAPDTWGFPEGNAERYETDVQTALRELKEEVGVELTPEQLGKRFDTTYFTGDYGGEKNRFQEVAIFCVFATLSIREQAKTTPEAVEIAWAYPHEIGRPGDGCRYALGFYEIDINLVNAGADYARQLAY